MSELDQKLLPNIIGLIITLTFLLVASKRRLKGEHPEIISKLKPLEVLEGNTAKLRCRIIGSPSPSVEWFRNGVRMKPNHRVLIEGEDELFTLTITDAQFDDEGKYKIVARNDLGECSSAAEVRITEMIARPEFLQQLSSVKVTEGDDTNFEVRVKAKPLPEIEWFKGTKQIEDAGRYELSEDDQEGLYSLVIRNTILDDAGGYRCVVINEAGRASSRAELKVTEKFFAPRFIDSFDGQPLTFNQGTDVTLSAQVSAKPDAYAEWFKENLPCTKHRPDMYEHAPKGLFRLVIANATPEDSGIYTVEIKNSIGMVKRTFVLNIVGESLSYVTLPHHDSYLYHKT